MLTFSQGRALVIGVNENLNPQLRLTLGEAQDLAAALVDPKFSAYSPDRVRLVTGKDATRADVLTELRRLAALAKPEDTVLIFFSGQSGLGNNGEFQFATYDVEVVAGRLKAGTGLSAAELVDILRTLKSEKVLLILNTGITPPAEFAHEFLATGMGRALLTANRASEFSYYRIGDAHSPMADALLDALAGKGVSERDGYIELFDLYQSVYDGVKTRAEEMGKAQTPGLNIIAETLSFPIAAYRGGRGGTLGTLGGEEDAAPSEPSPAVESINYVPDKVIQLYVTGGTVNFNTGGVNVSGGEVGVKGDVVGGDKLFDADRSKSQTIDFGSGSNFGSVIFGDVAAGDIKKSGEPKSKDEPVWRGGEKSEGAPTKAVTPQDVANAKQETDLPPLIVILEAQVSATTDIPIFRRQDSLDALRKAREAGEMGIIERMREKLEEAYQILNRLLADTPSVKPLLPLISAMLQWIAQWMLANAVPPPDALTMAQAPEQDHPSLARPMAGGGAAPPAQTPLELTLRIVPAKEAAQVTWEADVIGHEESTFRSPYVGSKLALLLKALNHLQENIYTFSKREQEQLTEFGLWDADNVAPGAPQVVGHALYEALTKGQTQAQVALSTARNYAAAQGIALSYVLRFPQNAVELAALPWELLWDDENPVLQGGGPLASCVRYLDLPKALPPAMAAGKTLRILAISPEALIPNYLREKERAARLNAWSGLIESGAVVMDELKPATPAALVDRFQGGAPIDIVHFYGHGRYKGGVGSLLLDDGAGDEAWIPAARLVSLMSNVRMVVLHACNSAKSDQGLLTGIAPALSAAGVPIVIAMQLRIRVEMAIRFAYILYRDLAAGESVQYAVSRARQGLYFQEGEGVSWFVPTVTIRARDTQPVRLVKKA